VSTLRSKSARGCHTITHLRPPSFQRANKHSSESVSSSVFAQAEPQAPLGSRPALVAEVLRTGVPLSRVPCPTSLGLVETTARTLGSQLVAPESVMSSSVRAELW